MNVSVSYNTIAPVVTVDNTGTNVTAEVVVAPNNFNVTIQSGIKGDKGDSATATTGTAVLSFPARNLSEENTTTTTISNAIITNAAFKGAVFIPMISADHDSLSDFAWDGIIFNIENIIDNTSFDIRARATNNSWGNYNVKYIILT